jgi:hypothetical protein
MVGWSGLRCWQAAREGDGLIISPRCGLGFLAQGLRVGQLPTFFHGGPQRLVSISTNPYRNWRSKFPWSHPTLEAQICMNRAPD